MATLEDLSEQLLKNRITQAYRTANNLKRKGIPITTIRCYIYDFFMSFNLRKQQQISRTFKGYSLEYWIK